MMRLTPLLLVPLTALPFLAALPAADHLELVDAEGKTVRIAKDDIDDRRVSDVSIVPVGLGDTLSREEFADPISYLLSLRQVAPKKQAACGLASPV